MSFHKEDGVSSLCQKALHIVTELCFAGQVEWEKCSSIFPRTGATKAEVTQVTGEGSARDLAVLGDSRSRS